MNPPKEYIETKSKPENGAPEEQKAQYNHTHSGSEEDEIDLLELFQQVWGKRKIIFVTTGIAFILGLFIAIVSPAEYSAEIVLMPQTSNSGSIGGSSSILRQLGGFAGVSLGGASGTLDKTLYPDITQSTSSYLAIMEKEMYFPTLDTTMSLYYYFTEVDNPPVTEYIKQYTLGLPRLLIQLPVRLLPLFDKPAPNAQKLVTPTSEDTLSQISSTTVLDRQDTLYQPITLNGRQLSVMSKLKNRIITTIEDNGMVKVSATMPDPLIAAKTTELSVNYLTQYITDYRIEKAQADLTFIEQQYEAKKARYNQSQQRLAAIQDRNANIVTERGRIELKRAETEYNLAFSLYQSVAQQLEQARIKVQEETPAFKVLEPIQIPLRKSEPNEELIIILSLFAGIAIGFAIVTVQIIYGNLKLKAQ
ncbi:MAG: Wzz/FepE/Etk N-terminal domain-containing protein [Bacteroidota bacterium]